MQAARESAFDCLAPDYDAVWTNTPVGMSQRLAVWEWIDQLFRPGDFVLDIGCGTGVDALHLQSRGVSVYGVDSSPSMVLVAKARGVNAHCLPIEDLNRLPMRFRGVLSNFGALNCIPSLEPVAQDLARLVRPGGFVAICLFGPFCVWEICHYLSKGRFSRAFRRLRRQTRSSLGIDVFYFSRRAVISAFRPEFRFVDSRAIGLFVPPSYVTGLTEKVMSRLATLDNRLAHLPVLRGWSDHCLYIFERI